LVRIAKSFTMNFLFEPLWTFIVAEYCAMFNFFLMLQIVQPCTNQRPDGLTVFECGIIA
jgi:hypothetical protein